MVSASSLAWLPGLATSPVAIVTWVGGILSVFVFANDVLARIWVRAATVDRALYGILIVALVWRWLLQADSRRPRGRTEIAMIVYLAIVLASWAMTWSAASRTSFARDAALILDGLLMPYGAFLLAREARWTPRRATGALWGLVGVVGTYLVAVGILEQLYGVKVSPRTHDLVHVGRVTGPFTNAIGYGLVLAMLFVMALFLRLQATRTPAKVASVVLAAGFLLGIVLSKGRAVWLTIPLAIVLVCRARPQLWRPALLACLIAAGLAWPILAASPPRPSRVDDGSIRARATAIRPIQNRVATYAISANMIVRRPLFGWGFSASTFERHKDAHHPRGLGIPREWAWFPSVPHNEFLFVLLLTGIVGLAAYLFLLSAMWIELSAAARTPAGHGAFRGEIATFVRAVFGCLVINALAVDLMLLPYVLILFFFLVGMATAPPSQDAAAGEGPDERGAPR